MNRLFSAVVSAGLLVLAAASFGQKADSRLFRQPDISRTQIVFVYGGDLWTVPRAGGVARRLTANPSLKRFPKFSPDGRWIAFTGNYDGNDDVYVMPSEGGEPKRLTWHPQPDSVLGWTPDGKSVLFRSRRASWSQRFSRLFTVPVAGGMETMLPTIEAGLAAFSPDGGRLAYNRIERESATWKRYRGGLQSYISLYDLLNNSYSELPHTEATDFFPMWHGDQVYFASDRSLVVNLFAYDPRGRAVKQLTHYADYDVKWPSMGPDAIVYEHGGQIRAFDVATGKDAAVPIELYSDMSSARPGLQRVESRIASFGISPTGARAVFTARGEVFTVPAKKGDSRNLSNTPGARELNAVWSPDGKWIAYLSDKSGEVEVYIRPQDGSGPEQRITADGHIHRSGPVWSPDSKTLLYTDADVKLWSVGIDTRTPTLIDSSALSQLEMGRWSPDSKWIVYSKAGENRIRRLWLYSVDQKKTFPVSDGRYADHDPVFDRSGKYLYFVSDRTFTPSMIGPEPNINFQNTAGIYALLLSRETASPFAPQSDEEKVQNADTQKSPEPPSSGQGGAKPAPPAGGRPPGAPDATGAGAAPAGPKPLAPTRIDLDGVYSRIVAIPVPPGRYMGLEAGTEKVFYVTGGPERRTEAGPQAGALHQYDMAKQADAVILTGISGYDLNPAASKILYAAPGNTYGIVDPAPGQTAGAGKLTLELEARTDPRAEWNEVFWDAWRYERDYFYDPNMKGMDWKAIGNRYASLLPGVSGPDDLSYVLGELVGELDTSHAYVMSGPQPEVKHIPVGLLGIDWEADGGFYRVKKIYAGENWAADRRSPLTMPGVNVKEGDYVLAVNGQPLRTDTNPYAPFEGTVGKIVTIRVNSQPVEEGSRVVEVRPIADESSLRNFDWVESNRRKVEAATGGRVGYMYVPDTSVGGIVAFGREFYSQTDKDALIVDERYNSGGFIPDFFVEKLRREVMSVGTPRYGADFFNPGAAVYGPKVILENEWSGSGGDAFPYFFRKAGVGPVIGKRTWGGLVGINGSYELMNGAAITAPQFGLWSPQEGRWIAENHGIEPDIEVANTPDKMQNGSDPQLDRAIATIQAELRKRPPVKPRHPPFPVEKLPAPNLAPKRP